MNNQMWTEAHHVVKRLIDHGFEAYIVGGAVRNMLLNLPVNDIDICTSALPMDVLTLFPKAIPTGIAFGTVTVVNHGNAYEVTTFRTEGDYSDGRRPGYVSFVPSLVEDLSRRDFTINAMALNQHGEIIDPFGGQEDLKNRKIKAVGEPLIRFQEDSLRIIRAVRFMSQLGFTIEPETESAMRECKHLINRLAVERITSELKKMMGHDAAAIGWNKFFDLHLYDNVDAFKEFKQEINVPKSISFLEVDDYMVRWAVLLASIGLSSQQAAHLLKRLTFSKKEVKEIDLLLSLKETYPVIPEQADIISLLMKHGLDLTKKWLILSHTVLGTSVERVRKEIHSLERLYEALPIHSYQELAINGKQIIELIDKKQGKWIQRLLDRLTLAVSVGECRNDFESLVSFAKNVVGDIDERENS